MILFTKQAQKEIMDFPESIREDLADALARLDAGLMLSMPLSRPMPSLGKSVHELRLKETSGIYRVIYAIVVKNEILVLLGFKKTTQQTPDRIMKIAAKRLKERAK